MNGQRGLGQFRIGQAVDRARGQPGDIRCHPLPRLVHDLIFAHTYDTVGILRSTAVPAETVVAQTIHDQALANRGAATSDRVRGWRARAGCPNGGHFTRAAATWRGDFRTLVA